MSRITLVLEYENDDAIPRIGSDSKDFGDFKLHAIQFNDALKELEVLSGYCTEEQRLQAHRAADTSTPEHP